MLSRERKLMGSAKIMRGRDFFVATPINLQAYYAPYFSCRHPVNSYIGNIATLCKEIFLYAIQMLLQNERLI